MKYSQYSSIDDSVGPYYFQQYNKAAKEQNITSDKLDNAMTTIFVGVNIVYFLFWGLIAKSTFGEMSCGLTTFDCNGTKSDLLSMIFRTMVLSLLLNAFVGFRYLVDSTYLKVSLLLLLVNWCLLFYNGRSLVDIFSFTKLQKITQ